MNRNLLLVFSFLFRKSSGILNPPVRCYGPISKLSEGKYYFHDNGTYLLRLSTNVEVELDLGLRSCFQVNIDNAHTESNVSDKRPTSLFYSMRYLEYQQTYDIRQHYQFGIAEIQSFCKCDCPGSDDFCTYEYGKKTCSKGEVCVTKYHGLQVRNYKDRLSIHGSIVDS